MKTLFLLAIPAVATYMALSTADNNHMFNLPATHGDKYCAKMRDGRMIVMHEGSQLTSDVTLANGTQVKMDGTIIMKDGTQSSLHEGECVDKDGKIVDRKSKDKDSKKQ